MDAAELPKTIVREESNVRKIEKIEENLTL